MSPQLATAAPPFSPAPDETVDFADWEFDVSLIESGPEADRLIKMTDDGCNSTCATACTSCP